MAEVTPGFKTSEFWITAFLALAGTVSLWGLPEGHTAVKIAAVATSVLAALGYTAARMFVKNKAIEEQAKVEIVHNDAPGLPN